MTKWSSWSLDTKVLRNVNLKSGFLRAGKVLFFSWGSSEIHRNFASNSTTERPLCVRGESSRVASYETWRGFKTRLASYLPCVFCISFPLQIRVVPTRLDWRSETGCVQRESPSPGIFYFFFNHNERQTESGHLVLLKREMLERGKYFRDDILKPANLVRTPASDEDLSHAQWSTESWLLTDGSARVREKSLINAVRNRVGRHNLAVISRRAHRSSDTQGNVSKAVPT